MSELLNDLRASMKEMIAANRDEALAYLEAYALAEFGQILLPPLMWRKLKEQEAAAQGVISERFAVWASECLVPIAKKHGIE